MVTLYDRDAADVRDALALLAAYAAAQQGTSDLTEWIDTVGKAHSATIAADHPSQRGRLTAARLTTMAAAIEEQLPPALRTPKSRKAVGH
jgi:hypothetical protein